MSTFHIYVALEIEARASHVLDKCSIPKTIFDQFYFDFETQSH